MGGTPQSCYKLWSSHPTTRESLPRVVADVVSPGWQAEVGCCTRLCCNLSYRHMHSGMFSRQAVSFCPVTHWQAENKRWFERSIGGAFGACVAYFSSQCAASLAYVVHRLGQFQA